jgi:hypothetical protein
MSTAVSLHSSSCDKTVKEDDGQRVNYELYKLYKLYKLVREPPQKRFIEIQFKLRKIGENNWTFASPLVFTEFKDQFSLLFC